MGQYCVVVCLRFALLNECCTLGIALRILTLREAVDQFFSSRTESLNIDTHLIGDCLFSSSANAISNHYQESSLYNWRTTNAPISVVCFPLLGLIAHVDTKIPNVVICFLPVSVSILNQILQILGKPFVITEILTEIDGIFFEITANDF